MELNGCSHRTWKIRVLAVMQPVEVEFTVCPWEIDSVKTLARGHLCNILAKNISYSGFSMRYWVGKSLKIIAWFVYFYSIYMYLFTFPIYIFIQYTFQLQPPPLSTLHSPSSLTPFHLPRESGDHLSIPATWQVRSLLLRSDKAAKLEEQVGQTDNTLRDFSSLYFFQDPCEDWSTFTTYMVGPWPTLCLLFSGESLSENLLVYRLVDSLDLLIDFLFLCRPSILSPNSSKWLPKPCPMIGCESLHLSVRCWMETLRGQLC